MKKTFLPISAVCLLVSGCANSAKNEPVVVVDRSASPAPDRAANPLTLVVRVEASGRLTLNKIETGTTADLSELTENLRAIFADRERVGISRREVQIEPLGEIDEAELENLVENLKAAQASPIRVINFKGGNLQ